MYSILFSRGTQYFQFLGCLSKVPYTYRNIPNIHIVFYPLFQKLYDQKFATATEYNEADYAAYNELKAQYDRQMHEWEKASYELEITENQ